MLKKQLTKIASYLFPKLMVNMAYNTLTNPQVKKLRAHELAVLDTAKKSKLTFTGFDIQLYEWGNPKDEKILLIHGWGGQAGNFADLIQVLSTKPYHLIAFDGPAHGFSSKGQTSLFEFSDLVAELINRFQPRKLVSHSFGGVATTFALYRNQHLEIEKYILLTTPDRFAQRIEDVANFVGITQKVKQLLVQRLETELKVDVDTFNVSDFVKEIKVKEAKIIHDKNDKVISLAQSQEVSDNWAVCSLQIIENTGHFRILRTPKVLEEVVGFLA